VEICPLTPVEIGSRFALFMLGEEEVTVSKMKEAINNANGKVGWILLWALGVPIPVLFILFLIRGCT
jgi:hypothetical protein